MDEDSLMKVEGYNDKVLESVSGDLLDGCLA